MQVRIRSATAPCVGVVFGISILGLGAWWAFAAQQTAPAPQKSVAAVPQAAARPQAADAMQAAIGQMLVADTTRRLGKERVDALSRQLDERCQRDGFPQPQLCFAPGTPDDVIAQYLGNVTPRFFQVARWSVTATDGSTGSEGDPITLTYSFPPDGTTIPDIGVGFPPGTNALQARLNGLYGSQAVWQPIFAQIFARWSEVSGITYVYEPNDDGAPVHNSPGVLGVRGDLRISGEFLDGNSNVLAYNNFPDDGDMVIDSADNFFDDTSNNSLRLRNIVAHEHGHGIGELHVCPLNETRLMEPIATTAFDGPQHDDIRNAQGHYGDPNEPDNSPAQATDIGMFAIPSSQTFGLLGPPAISNGATLSIDANGEQDYFRLSVASPAALSVTVIPVGTNYEDSPQDCTNPGNAYCCSGTFTNSLAIADLAVQVIDSNGLTVLDTAASTPAGSVETLSDVILDGAGDYYVRVYETNSPDQPQLYRLIVATDTVPYLPVTISLPSGAPSELVPGQATTFDVEVNANDDAIVGGSALLYYRYDGGAYSSTPLTPLGGSLYEATLPAASCGDSPEFYVEAEGVTTGFVTSPNNGAANPLTAIVGTEAVFFSDNGETDPGWVVSGDAADGQWDRGVPVNNDRGDPPSDFDGSGQCWLTDNDSNNSNSDVDDGDTILTSPVFDLSTTLEPTITYARWLDNSYGSNPGEDPMTVEVSDNGGGSWTTLEVVGPSGAEASGGWYEVTFTISDYVAITSQFQIRFTVGDTAASGSVVEAGVDAVHIDGIDCEETVTAPSPPTGVAASDETSCNEVTVTWNASATADDYDVYRNSLNDSGSATMITSGVAATSYSDTGATPGTDYYYWVQACNAGGCSGFGAADPGARADVPAAVSNVAATNGSVCGAIDVSWDSLTGATQYHVYRNTVSDFGTAGEIAAVSSSETSFEDGSVDTSVSYFYWVVAENDCGSGSESGFAEGIAGIRGDFNLDGLRDGRDIQGMIDAYLGDSSLVPCADFAAPAGVIDATDIGMFVDLLVAP